MAKTPRTTAPATAKAKTAAKPASPDEPTAPTAEAKPTTPTAEAKPNAPTAKARPKAAAVSANTNASAKANVSAKDGAKPAAAKPAAKATPKAAAAGLPEKPWLKSYPKVVPAEIGALPFGSIGDLLADVCKRYASRPAFTCMGKTISYAEVERQSAAFGAYLQSTGLPKGARVALMMPNVLQYPVAMMAVLRAGYVVVNVNPLYTPRELEHQLKDSGAQAIVILENFASTLQAVIAKTAVKHVVVAAMGDMLGGLKGTIVNLVVRRVKKMVPAWSLPGHVKFNDALKAGAGMSFKPVKVAADDVAFLQYTGGTTGISKGAVLLHSNVLANV
ncbi:MAG: long-chain fatty acid--CoA ligase, partial [Mesorhizobium sp.]